MTQPSARELPPKAAHAPATAPRLAASLLLLRDGAAGPEVYMVRRPPRSRFLPNALVFVGGQLELADQQPVFAQRTAGLTPTQAAARLGIARAREGLAFYVAALRECFEEAGVLLAQDDGGRPLGAHPELAGLRSQLTRGELSFAVLLQRLGLSLALGELRYLDHWITPEGEPRRYDTRFFACRAPAAQVPLPDPQETSAGGWFSPAAVLAQSLVEEVLLAPPTLVLLELIARHQTVEEILAACPDGPLAAVQPRPLPGAPDGPLVLLLPGDQRLTAPGSTGGPVNYVVLRGQHWEHVRRDAGAPGE